MFEHEETNFVSHSSSTIGKGLLEKNVDFFVSGTAFFVENNFSHFFCIYDGSLIYKNSLPHVVHHYYALYK